jgi:hypothetical protein
VANLRDDAVHCNTENDAVPPADEWDAGTGVLLRRAAQATRAANTGFF